MQHAFEELLAGKNGKSFVHFSLSRVGDYVFRLKRRKCNHSTIYDSPVNNITQPLCCKYKI